MQPKKKKSSRVFTIVFVIITAASLTVMLMNPGKQHLKRVTAYVDNCLPSKVPPAGLDVIKAPQFVVFGFDDNAYSGLEGSGDDGGMVWALDFFNSQKNPAGTGNGKTFDGEQITAGFYLSTMYIEKWISEDPRLVREMWKKAWETGHEIGLHSHYHAPEGNTFSFGKWDGEINTCLAWLSGSSEKSDISISAPDAGIPGHEIIGWRSPHLLFNNSLFVALKKNKVLYDCSIEEGWQEDADGKTLMWPYTLDKGSPGNIRNREMKRQERIDDYAGLWEIPVYPVFVPPDELCSKYGITPGFRARIKQRDPYFDPNDGKILGFDYNLWVILQFSAEEFLAVMKYTLDLRLEGNRAPFCFGAHTDYYSSKYKGAYFSGDKKDETGVATTSRVRQKAVEDFIRYALSKPEVRMVSGKKLLEWMRNPVSL